MLSRLPRAAFVFVGACWLGTTGSSCASDPPSTPSIVLPDHRSVGFHGDRRKLGWVDAELALPARLVKIGFGVGWESPRFDDAEIDGTTYPPLTYASPLFARDVRTGRGLSDVVYAATSSGFVYGVLAPRDGGAGIVPGEFLFQTKIVTPSLMARLDGGVPMGILSTPVLDVDTLRLYVVGFDASRGWLAFALNAVDGTIVNGWPVAINQGSVGGVNANGPSIGQARFPDPLDAVQRSALALSPSGDRLYVGFASHEGTTPGWLVAIDTALDEGDPRVARSFSAAATAEPKESGGIGGAGGPAIDPTGRIWVTTGSSPAESKDTPRVWGNSLLVLDRDFTVTASYTPYNYCTLDANKIHLGSSGPVLLPNLNPAQTSTPQLTAFGGQQGNVYLLDRTRPPGAVDRRPPCGSAPEADTSLLPILAQPPLNVRSPLNVFGPFSDAAGDGDHSRMQTRPAYFRDGAEHWLVVTGTYKSSPESTSTVAPSIAKVRVAQTANKPAHLERGTVNASVVLQNPGSPVVTGENDEAVVWVVDRGSPASRSPLDQNAPLPVLYAFAARDLSVIWQSPVGTLQRMGSYGVPAIGNGRVYVATDKLTAFTTR